MNITGNNLELQELDRDYLKARKALSDACEKHLGSERAKFALKVLLMDEPIKYLETVVRNEVAGQSTNSLNQSYEK